MDYKQAKGLLQHHIKTWEGKFPSGHFEACRVGMKALDKQIPKRVDRVVKTEHFTLCVCPSCGKDNYESRMGSYCQNCGQKIDWSDKDEYK